MTVLPTGSFQAPVYRGLIQGGLLRQKNRTVKKVYFVHEHQIRYATEDIAQVEIKNCIYCDQQNVSPKRNPATGFLLSSHLLLSLPIYRTVSLCFTQITTYTLPGRKKKISNRSLCWKLARNRNFLHQAMVWRSLKNYSYSILIKHKLLKNKFLSCCRCYL